MNAATTRCGSCHILILWTHWATAFQNLLSVSHLKPGLRYVGDIWSWYSNIKLLIYNSYL